MPSRAARSYGRTSLPSIQAKGPMSEIHPVILCGGSGTRLWPRSRADRPKPFLPLLGEETLFEATVARTSDPARFAPPLVIAGARHLDQVESQLRGASGARVIVEPEGRNTAPAIALAARCLPEDAVMLVCPSDHHIADRAAFVEAAEAAAMLAREGRLVALGIAADRAETGYGYIKRGASLARGFEVERFVEKPDRARAERFLAEGGYDWNGGIFALRAGTFLEELAAQRPQMAEQVRAAHAAGRWEGARFEPGRSEFLAIEGDSIDYAVMEKTARAAVVPVSMGWSDIGNWEALRDAREKDPSGNCVSGPADLVDCHGVLVESDGPRVSAIGLENVMIVVDGDEIMVTSAAGAQKVGKLPGANGK